MEITQSVNNDNYNGLQKDMALIWGYVYFAIISYLIFLNS